MGDSGGQRSLTFAIFHGVAKSQTQLSTEQQEMKRIGTVTKNKVIPTEIQLLLI